MSSEETARKFFSDHGLDPGELVNIYTEYHFKDGGACYGMEFKRGDIHFHVGKGAWKEHLAPDAPETRIRRMIFDGKPVAELEWYSC